MKRIFFIENDFNQLTEEQNEVINKHKSLGVEVYVTDVNQISSEEIKFCVIDSKGLIAWESFLGAKSEIIWSLATANKVETQKYVDIFEKIMRMATTKKL